MNKPEKVTVKELIKEFKNLARIMENQGEDFKEAYAQLSVRTEPEGLRYALRYTKDFGYIFGMALCPSRIICLPFLEEDSLKDCIEKFESMLNEYFIEYSKLNEESYDDVVYIIR